MEANSQETGSKIDSTKSGPPFALNDDEYELVGSLVETFVPSGENPDDDPGGKEVGAKNYFDSELLNFPNDVRSEVLETLSVINQESKSLYRGRSFPELSIIERTLVVKRLLGTPSVRARMMEVRSLCLEGFYSDYHDPDYKGKAAWEWTEYKGKGITGLKKDWTFLEVYRSKMK